MKIADWLMILSVLLAPLIAVQVQKYLERYREDRDRRLNVFKTLMATRADVISRDHVQALNMIDLEYYGNKYKKITDAWKTYRDHLNHYPDNDEKQQPSWQAENVELLNKLLIEMGQSLGYDFDTVHVKRAIYSPVAHAQIERENLLIRDGLIRLLQGDTNLKMDIQSLPVSDPQELEEQKAIREQLQELLEGTRNLGVVVTNSGDTQCKDIQQPGAASSLFR